jgi:hypothetical protein
LSRAVRSSEQLIRGLSHLISRFLENGIRNRREGLTRMNGSSRIMPLLTETAGAMAGLVSAVCAVVCGRGLDQA